MEPRPPEFRPGSNGSSQEVAGQADPRHCVLLRAGGLLSVLDMDQVCLALNPLLLMLEYMDLSWYCSIPGSPAQPR